MSEPTSEPAREGVVSYLGPVGCMAERVAGMGSSLEGAAIGMAQAVKPETIVRVDVSPSGRITIKIVSPIEVELDGPAE